MTVTAASCRHVCFVTSGRPLQPSIHPSTAGLWMPSHLSLATAARLATSICLIFPARPEKAASCWLCFALLCFRRLLALACLMALLTKLLPQRGRLQKLTFPLFFFFSFSYFSLSFSCIKRTNNNITKHQQPLDAPSLLHRHPRPNPPSSLPVYLLFLSISLASESVHL